MCPFWKQEPWEQDMTRISYNIYGTLCKVKMWGPFPKITRNSERGSRKHESTKRGPSSLGPCMTAGHVPMQLCLDLPSECGTETQRGPFREHEVGKRRGIQCISKREHQPPFPQPPPSAGSGNVYRKYISLYLWFVTYGLYSKINAEFKLSPCFIKFSSYTTIPVLFSGLSPCWPWLARFWWPRCVTLGKLSCPTPTPR